MSIQFFCSSCGKQVTTSDQMAGKQGKCPHCKSVVKIPSTSSPTKPLGRPLGVLDDLPTQDATLTPTPSSDPLGAAPVPNHFANSAPLNSPAPNPYSSPVMGRYSSPQKTSSVQGQLVGPAVGMITASGMSLLVGLAYVVRLLVTFAFTGSAAQLNTVPEVVVGGIMTAMVIWIAFTIIWLAISTITLIGSIKILFRSNYRLAKTASILSLVPCTPCFIIGIPFGIWGLIVLSDPTVKQAFNN